MVKSLSRISNIRNLLMEPRTLTPEEDRQMLCDIVMYFLKERSIEHRWQHHFFQALVKISNGEENPREIAITFLEEYFARPLGE